MTNISDDDLESLRLSVLPELRQLASDELRAVFGDDGDFHPDNGFRQRRFNWLRTCLIEEKSFLCDIQPDELALQTLNHLGKLLRMGQVDQKTLNILADFITGITTETDKSTRAHKQNSLLAYRVLGYKPNGRTDKALYHLWALDAFEAATDDGASLESAERAAYDAYFEVEGRNYASDSLKHQDRNGAKCTKAELTMEAVIRPALRKAKLIVKKSAGRPKRVNQCPSKPPD
jgi:hypothetical protein